MKKSNTAFHMPVEQFAPGPAPVVQSSYPAEINAQTRSLQPRATMIPTKALRMSLTSEKRPRCWHSHAHSTVRPRPAPELQSSSPTESRNLAQLPSKQPQATIMYRSLHPRSLTVKNGPRAGTHKPVAQCGQCPLPSSRAAPLPK